MIRSTFLAGTAAILLHQPALAQADRPADAPATATTAPSAEPARRPAHEESEAIVITADYVDRLDVLGATSVLTGTDLVRDVRPQIGDTLVRLPGISATSFSPGASRPVLRGFQGERVRVLTDGIGSIDASNTSADHAVTIDPLTADRIEVLHGPAVLLFGSQAIGGAVNVIDRRIPRERPENGIHVDVIGALGTAADERSIGGAADVAIGDSGFVVHADGSFRKTDDLEVGGFVLSPELRAEQLEIAQEEEEEGHLEEAEEARELAGLRGRLPNSATEQKTAGFGLAYVSGGTSIGGSVSWFDSDYGVPARPGAEHHHEEGEGEGGEEEEEHEHGEEPVTIGMEQFRADFRAEIELGGGFLDHIHVRGALADYEHTEFEGEEVGTVFKNKGQEVRVEFAQAERNGWRGASGVQFLHRDFDAIGAEAFVPQNDTSQIGLFTLQEVKLGAIELEGAARYEHTEVTSDPVDFDRSFDAWSAAIGISHEIGDSFRLGLNGSRAQRAPSAEELLSNGPHIATQAFEIGDPNLTNEKSWGVEAYAHYETDALTLKANVFANWFDDFIFDAATGEEEDELPVFQYFQRDARFFGFELEGSARLFEAGAFTFVADAVADYVRATIKDGGPLPRIPPLRLLGGLEAQSDRWSGRIEAEWVDDQDRTAELENPTDGHTLVNASIAWKPWGRERETVLVLSANNIFDVDARRHASFTKDFVPLAGRDFRLSARFSF
jgi:iron complex outermembrane receptor protein